MSSSFWKKFLIDAGIPLKASSTYANAFVDNRLTENMIPDLNKSVLTDLGITIIGDIISILKHAIFITEQNTKKLSVSKGQKPSEKSKGKNNKNDEDSKKDTKSKESRSKSTSESKKTVENIKPTLSEEIKTPVKSPVKQQADKVVQCESKSVQAASTQSTTLKSTKVLGKRKVNVTREVDDNAAKDPPDFPVNNDLTPTKLSAEKIVKKVMAFTANDNGDSYDESYDEDDEPVETEEKQYVSETESDVSEAYTRHVVNLTDHESVKISPSKRVVVRSAAADKSLGGSRSKRIVRKVIDDSSFISTAEPRITRVVTPVVQKVRCVSPDSTTDDLFPTFKRQKTSVLLNKTFPLIKPSVVSKTRTPSAKTKRYSEKLSSQLVSDSPRYKFVSKNGHHKIPTVQPEEINSFRSDGERKKSRDFNRFRSENDAFEHISDDDRSKPNHPDDTSNFRSIKPMSERLGKFCNVSGLRSDMEPLRISNKRNTRRMKPKQSISMSSSESFLSNEKVISKSVFSRLGR